MPLGSALHCTVSDLAVQYLQHCQEISNIYFLISEENLYLVYFLEEI